MDLHFHRYRADSAEDRQVFQGVLLTFQKQLPFTERGTDLTVMWEFLYERSVGCGGILKEWLMRACVRAIKHGAGTLSREHLEKTALAISQCEKILAEAREGETRLNDNEDSRSRLRTLLGIEPQSRGSASPKPVAAPLPRNRKGGRVGKVSRKRSDHTGNSAGVCMTLSMEAGNWRVLTRSAEATYTRCPDRSRHPGGRKPYGIHRTSGRSSRRGNRRSRQSRTASPNPVYKRPSGGINSHPAAGVFVLSRRPFAQWLRRPDAALGRCPRTTDQRSAARSSDSPAVGQRDLVCTSPAPLPRLVFFVL